MLKFLVALAVVSWFSYFLGCYPEFRAQVIDIVKKFIELVIKIIVYIKGKITKGVK